MSDPIRLNRRLLVGAAGALSVVGSLSAAAGRAAPKAEVPTSSAALDSVKTLFCLEAKVSIAAAVTVGQSAYGLRRLIPITGGSFTGPRIHGEVVPGGADYQVVRPDGVTTVEARYTLRASDGALIYIANRGIIVRDPAARGDATVQASYIRTAPEFEAPIGPHDWLNKSLFVGTLDGSHAAQGYVVIRVYQVV